MTVHEQIEFHADRAAAELDLAERALSVHAAHAHFGLSALHRDRLRALGALEARAQLIAAPAHSSSAA